MSAAAGDSTKYAVMLAARKVIQDRMYGVELASGIQVASYRDINDGFAVDLIDGRGITWSCEFVAVGVGRGRKCTP